MDPAPVVDAALRGLERGGLFVVPGLFYRVLVLLMRHAPVPLRLALALRYGRKMKRIGPPPSG
jgi:hypothetical protein